MKGFVVVVVCFVFVYLCSCRHFLERTLTTVCVLFFVFFWDITAREVQKNNPNPRLIVSHSKSFHRFTVDFLFILSV